MCEEAFKLFACLVIFYAFAVLCQSFLSSFIFFSKKKFLQEPVYGYVLVGIGLAQLVLIWIQNICTCYQQRTK